MIQFKNASQYINDVAKYLRRRVGNNLVLVAVSGGVDSSVSAALINAAGLKSSLVFIDSGFLRLREVEDVLSSLSRAGFSDVTLLNKKDKFYSAQHGLTDPRRKREVFRDCYYGSLFNYAAEKGVGFIAQGTQYYYNSIKPYNSVPTNEILTKGFEFIEPVRGISKTNIREIARYFNMPSDIVHREAFPGPGLLIRMSGEFSEGKLTLTREATKVVEDVVRENIVAFRNCFQMFPYLEFEDPITYVSPSGPALGCIVLLRAVRQVVSGDEVTYLPFELPTKVSQLLVSELMKLEGVGRVCFDLTPKYQLKERVHSGGTVEFQ